MAFIRPIMNPSALIVPPVFISAEEPDSTEACQLGKAGDDWAHSTEALVAAEMLEDIDEKLHLMLLNE